MKIKGIFALFLFLLFANVIIAQSFGQNLRNTFGGVCFAAKSILGISMIVLIILAAIVYGLGQMLGAETRARATVWATAMFTGAIVAALIYVVVPYIVSAIMTGQATGEWVDKCCVENPSADCTELESSGSDSANSNSQAQEREDQPPRRA